jgi:hypothetical protein
MSNGLNGLLNALQERERLRGFASRLENLRDDGTLSEDDYATGKADYEGRIDAGTHSIHALKAALSKELEAARREAEMCRLKIESAEAHHEAGETSDSAFHTERQRWTTQLGSIEKQVATLETALAAETAADLQGLRLEVTADSASPPAPEKKKPQRVDVPRTTGEEPSSTSARGWTKLRIAAAVNGAVLLVSVRLAWLAPTELLGNGLSAEPGVSVTFLAGLGGIVLGLAAIGVSFIRKARLRGTLQLLAGLLAIVALIGAVFLRELPLHDSYFRELIVLREGFFTYVIAAVGLMVLGILQARH